RRDPRIAVRTVCAATVRPRQGDGVIRRPSAKTRHQPRDYTLGVRNDQLRPGCRVDARKAWVRDGLGREAAGDRGERAVRVAGLIDSLARARPLLHLHGRVGWFRRLDPDGTAETYATAAQSYQPSYGTPIVMLPNPNKLYDEDDVVNVLWRHTGDSPGDPESQSPKR